MILITLRDQLAQAVFLIERNGIEFALDNFLTEVAGDQQVEAALIQMKNAELAIMARIEQLKQFHNVED